MIRVDVCDRPGPIGELAHLRPLLGEKFYAELKLQNDTGTLSVANQTFMTYYLEDCLSWFTRFEVVNDIMSNITSSGVVHNIDEFSRIITPSDYNTFKQDTYRKAEIFANDMINFLDDTDQAGLYPTYESNKPNQLNRTYKNHGMIFYDSIYGYNGVEGCITCGTDYVNGNCNCGCGNC